MPAVKVHNGFNRALTSVLEQVVDFIHKGLSFDPSLPLYVLPFASAHHTRRPLPHSSPHIRTAISLVTRWAERWPICALPTLPSPRRPSFSSTFASTAKRIRHHSLTSLHPSARTTDLCRIARTPIEAAVVVAAAAVAAAVAVQTNGRLPSRAS
jgi:hypothetical protein